MRKNNSPRSPLPKAYPFRKGKTRHRARSLNSAVVEKIDAADRQRVSDMIFAPAPTPRLRLIEGGSGYRKAFPMCTGLMDYFPDALAAVSEVSFKGNAKHNPGEPMHHARGKSMDHADCIARHLVERGGFDGDIRHTAALAWRALALLQEELEGELLLPLPRGAKA